MSDWIRNIEKGDVLESGSGVLRVVRSVKHNNGPRSHCSYVTFSILHCSWTKRPYTVLTSADLKTLGYRPTKIKGYPLDSPLDKAIEEDMHGRDGMALMGSKRKTFCCDVRGIT